MYEKLVKNLRGLSRYTAGTVTDLCKEAADVIEELSKLADEIPHVCEYCIGCEVESGGCDIGFVLSPKRAIEYLSKPHWIPVTEQLPEQGKRYLVIRFDEVTKTQFIDILWHDAHDLWWNRLYKGNYNVTHWMPLPELPKEDNNEI